MTQQFWSHSGVVARVGGAHHPQQCCRDPQKESRRRQRVQAVQAARRRCAGCITVRSVCRSVLLCGCSLVPSFQWVVMIKQGANIAGSSTLLSWRAAKLFAHVREVLAVSGMSTVIGAEYAAVLRTHLLSTPSYCESAKPEDAQGAMLILSAVLRNTHTSTFSSPCVLPQKVSLPVCACIGRVLLGTDSAWCWQCVHGDSTLAHV